LAGIAFTLSRALGRRLWLVMAANLLLIPAWMAGAGPMPNRFRPADQSRTLMLNAIEHITEAVPPGRVLFSDVSTQSLLRHYLGPTTEQPSPSDRFTHFDTPAWPLVAARSYRYFSSDSFGDEFARMAQAYGLVPDDTVCVVSVAPDTALPARLAGSLKIHLPGVATFGQGIGVFQMPVGREPSHENLVRDAEHTRSELLALVGFIARRDPPEVICVLAPSDLLDDSIRRSAAAISPLTLPYERFYQNIRTGEYLTDYLPALALWHFRSTEEHLPLMLHMDQGVNYVAARYRFTLLLLSPDGTSAAYLIQDMSDKEGHAP